MKLVKYSSTFEAYSNSTNDQAISVLNYFARKLFVWRRPYPIFQQSQASVLYTVYIAV